VSDNDPYCPGGPDAYKAIYTDALRLEHHVIPGAGHITIEDGYGAWPDILAWCLEGSSEWRPYRRAGIERDPSKSQVPRRE
jgi:hypothetical protein